MKKLTLLTLFTVLCFAVRAGITTVSLTGYNADIVSNGSAPAISTISSYMTDGFDSAGYALVSQDYNYDGYTPSYFLPTGGAVSSSITSGLNFQLSDYSANNALRLKSNGDTGSLYFVTPQTAGAIYLCGLSGSGLSDFNVTVNFSDGTSQSFTSLSFPDWYASGGSVQGIGRVSTTDNHTEGTSVAPSLFEIQLSIDPANYTKLITGISVSKTSSTGILAVMAISAEDICSGSPTAGTVSASATTGCSAYTSNLSLPSSTASTGIVYQWQSSTDGIFWTSIIGATDATYSPYITDSIYYRAYVTCTISGLSDTSDSVQLILTTPAPVVASLPFFESFENWIGSCYSFDRPGVNWLTNPTGGDDSWRRDDQGDDASWDFPSDGTYSPVSTDAAHSARFHSSDADYGVPGNMDLYVNLSTPGTKQITFDYNNGDGSDSYLNVMLSEDSGATFTTLGTFTGTSGWATEMLTTTSVAAHAIIRISATSFFAYPDMGIDSLAISLLPSCTGTPVAGTISASATTGCSAYSSTLSVDTPIFASGISYQWQSSSDDISWSNISGATNITYTAPSIAANTYFRAYVICSASTSSDTTSILELTYTGATPIYATVPYFQGFENWIAGCYSFDRPDASWLTNPSTGDDSWRRDDQGDDASWDYSGDGSYSPASTEGAHSARFHSYYAPFGTVGNMDLYINLSTPGTKQISFDYNNDNSDFGSDVLNVMLSEDGGATFTTLATYPEISGWQNEIISTASVAANAIIRFSATSDYGNTDIGIDSLYISGPATSSCSVPVAVSASGITDTSATILWDSLVGVAGYQYVINTTPADPTAAGIATVDTSVTIGSLAGSTTYYAHVRTECATGDSSAWVTIAFTTLATPCDTPIGATVTGITFTSATISWDSIVGVAGYQYVVNTTSADPTGAGTATADTSVDMSSLTPGTVYYAHIRTECGGGDSSVWITVSFTTAISTIPCTTASGLAASSITDSSAILSWNTVTGASGYLFVVDTSSTAPAITGNFTTDTSYTDTGLACGTTYYFHVRTDCGTDSASWATISFVTDSCPILSVSSIVANNFDVQAYPNPVTEKVNIQISGTISGQPKTELTDVTGKTIQIIILSGNKAEVDMSNLPSGIYFLNYSDNANRKTIKINKQ